MRHPTRKCPACPRAQPKEGGRGVCKASGGAPHTFPFSSHAPRSLPSELPLPGVKPRMSVFLMVCRVLLRAQGGQGACEWVVAGFTPLQVPPLAGLTWSPRFALARRSQARGGRRSVPSSEGGRGQPGRLIGRGSLPSLPALYVRVGGQWAPSATAPVPRAYWLISCMANCLTLN